MGLLDELPRPAGKLSHGQKQWPEIGMLLARDPRLLLVDEPAAGMTPAERERTTGLLRRAARKQAVIERLDRPNQLSVRFTGAQMGGVTEVELVQLTPHRTRLSLKVSAEAKTMATRLLFRSLTLGRSKPASPVRHRPGRVRRGCRAEVPQRGVRVRRSARTRFSGAFAVVFRQTCRTKAAKPLGKPRDREARVARPVILL